MAISLLNPHNSSFISHFSNPQKQIPPKTKTHISINLNHRFSPPLLLPSVNTRKKPHFYTKSASVDGVSIQNPYSDVNGEEDGFNGFLQKWVYFIQSIVPGGSWWKLSDKEVQGIGFAKPVTVYSALSRMWELVAKDRWVIFAAFFALTFAALSEISIPHFLAASIFSAQKGETMVFYRNAQLLVVLCFTSGICSGLRSCCFGIANLILVKRMREMLYSAILFQDISFFDGETVGDLTSRLESDCRQVSRVIGNDLNMILRNVLQGTCALIYLFILSWPLALTSLLLSDLLVFSHGHVDLWPKKAAKVTQEYTANANEETSNLYLTYHSCCLDSFSSLII